MAWQRPPRRVSVAAVVIVADDVTVLPLLERPLSLLLDEPIAEARTMQHALGHGVLHNGVAGGVADHWQVIIIGFLGCVGRATGDELPVVIAIHVNREAELAHAVFATDAL